MSSGSPPKEVPPPTSHLLGLLQDEGQRGSQCLSRQRSLPVSIVRDGTRHPEDLNQHQRSPERAGFSSSCRPITILRHEDYRHATGSRPFHHRPTGSTVNHQPPILPPPTLPRTSVQLSHGVYQLEEPWEGHVGLQNKDALRQSTQPALSNFQALFINQQSQETLSPCPVRLHPTESDYSLLGHSEDSMPFMVETMNEVPYLASALGMQALAPIPGTYLSPKKVAHCASDSRLASLLKEEGQLDSKDPSQPKEYQTTWAEDSDALLQPHDHSIFEDNAVVQDHFGKSSEHSNLLVQAMLASGIPTFIDHMTVQTGPVAHATDSATHRPFTVSLNEGSHRPVSVKIEVIGQPGSQLMVPPIDQEMAMANLTTYRTLVAERSEANKHQGTPPRHPSPLASLDILGLNLDFPKSYRPVSESPINLTDLGSTELSNPELSPSHNRYGLPSLTGSQPNCASQSEIANASPTPGTSASTKKILEKYSALSQIEETPQTSSNSVSGSSGEFQFSTSASSEESSHQTSSSVNSETPSEVSSTDTKYSSHRSTSTKNISNQNDFTSDDDLSSPETKNDSVQEHPSSPDEEVSLISSSSSLLSQTSSLTTKASSSSVQSDELNEDCFHTPCESPSFFEAQFEPNTLSSMQEAMENTLLGSVLPETSLSFQKETSAQTVSEKQYQSSQPALSLPTSEDDKAQVSYSQSFNNAASTTEDLSKIPQSLLFSVEDLTVQEPSGTASKQEKTLGFSSDSLVKNKHLAPKSESSMVVENLDSLVEDVKHRSKFNPSSRNQEVSGDAEGTMNDVYDEIHKDLYVRASLFRKFMRKGTSPHNADI